MERKIFTIKNIEQNCPADSTSSAGRSIKIFTLSPEDGKNIQFKPGQFAMLFQLDENGNFGKLSRPYSIASSPGNLELRLVIKITGGQFTSILDRMKEGDRLGVAGPLGHFAYSGEENIICIAAGTGVAPMLGILESVAQQKKKGRFTLFYSNKKKEWVACRSLLRNFENDNPGIKIVYTLTQDQPAEWSGELGRISEGMVRKHADYAKDATFFICGPMEFAKAMKEIALKLGADEKKIKIEAWG